MTMAGQTINDRLLAARHSLAGQGLAKSVCKATTEELIAPKKKHLDYLVHCTNEPNVSIPQLATLLIERSQNTNWVVVYKALITTHHLMAYGNERFMQYLASSNSSFNLSNFLDKGVNVVKLIQMLKNVEEGGVGMPGGRLGYDMSPFIRRYAKYLNEKSLSYRSMAFDFCKIKRNKEENSLRSMNVDKLLKALPILQGQLDGLLEFDCRASDLSNSVINVSFMLLFRDLIRLFACYNDGTINLLEKYFDMNKKNAREALDLYKKFLVRMDRVGEFLKVAENVGIDKGDIPDLTKAPSSLLDALEGHLAALEGRKISAANTPTQSASNNQKNVKFAVSALSFTSTAFGTAAASGKFDNNNGFDEQLKAQALADEEAAMSKYKSKLSSPTSSSAAGAGAGAGAALTNPFLSSPPAAKAAAPIVDLFGAAQAQPAASAAAAAAAAAANAKASDDLLQLGNPFADVFEAPDAGTSSGAALNTNNIWMQKNGFNGASTAAANAFVTDSNFTSVFGNSNPEATATAIANIENPFFDNAADVLQMARSAFFVPEQKQEQEQEQEQELMNPFGDTNTNAITSASVDLLKANDNMSIPGFDALGDVLKPGIIQSNQTTVITSGTTTTTTTSAFNQQQQQQQQQFFQQTQQTQQTQQQQNEQSTVGANNSGKIITGDLDSSLMSLVENLNINKTASSKPVQWNSPKNSAKSGGANNWTPQPMQATTGAGYRPMGMPVMLSAQGAAPLTGMQPTMLTLQSKPVLPQQSSQQQQQQQQQHPLQPLRPMQIHNGASAGGGIGSSNNSNNKNMSMDPFGAL